jgi:predicted oxidoreductase
MEQIRLGATGLHVSRVCLGMMGYGNASDRKWVLEEAAAEPIIRRAVEAGITFFDTEAGRCGSAYGRARGRLPVTRRGRAGASLPTEGRPSGVSAPQRSGAQRP